MDEPLRDRAVEQRRELPGQALLRTPVGPATAQLLGARAALDDAAFEQVARSAFTPPGW